MTHILYIGNQSDPADRRVIEITERDASLITGLPRHNLTSFVEVRDLRTETTLKIRRETCGGACNCALALVDASPEELAINWTVKTVVDVRRVLAYYIRILGAGFHPDNDGDDYVHAVKGKSKSKHATQSTFTGIQARMYDQAMEDCFLVCHEAKLDIYAIAIEIAVPLVMQPPVEAR